MQRERDAGAARAETAPSISLPKGGGAIQGIGEKFSANPVTGTGSMSIPIAISPSRFAPTLSLSYDSGSGNGPFGLGWSLSVPSISRKTDKGLPRYRDEGGPEESDVFVLSNADDLVPVLTQHNGDWLPEVVPPQTFAGIVHHVQRFRPRIEGMFARIERWTSAVDGATFWKTVSRDNVASLYGIDVNGRIADPANPARVFKWLLQREYDDKGNVAVFSHQAEDRNSVVLDPHERNRNAGAQRYLKRIDYGNVTPFYVDVHDAGAASLPANWYFHLVLDYGDHDVQQPQIDASTSWPARADAFSTYRAGFEIRTHRLCRRMLMFHEFPELGATPCLVKSTDFSHEESPLATVLSAVRHTGYRRDPATSAYTAKSLPPVEFTYSRAHIDDSVRDVPAEALENLPAGAAGAYQWLDLDSEGSPGILTRQGAGWFYKRNVSNLTASAAFEPVQCLPEKPSLGSARQQFADLAGAGQQCLVQFERPTAGFYARNEALGWEPFTAFESTPDIDFDDPNLRMLDLDGDGLPDILISDDEVFTWYAARGKQGFAPGEQVPRALDEDDGPALIFADGTQSIFFADMSGGGLTEIVRIRNGEICYWPNLGYGRFGRKVTMSDAPLFDAPEQFDPRRLRLADIDGTGTTDLVYLGSRFVAVYANLSGNRFSPRREIGRLPAPDNLSSVSVVDLLGNGTACLVWSSPLPGDETQRMRYVDLVGGSKPYLLTGAVNNLGAETHIHYAASTRFYLQDRQAGTPWITRLPFPVHVVDRVEVYDAISRTRFVSRYAYHHGFYDGAEREFRGFGMVEQWDAESFTAFAADPAVNLDETTALPPVLTRSWFHTGAYLQGARISLLFKDTYYREPGLAQPELDAMLLPDTILPQRLSAQDAREACRALKGAMLRQEIYALDGTPLEPHPYSVSERNFTIELLQPRAAQRHAAFFTHAREVVDYHYERALYDVGGQPRCDPRVSHAMTLAVDPYGNVLSSVAIGYGRRYDAADAMLTADDVAQQKKIAVTATQTSFTNAVLEPHAYRAPAVAESRTYELVKTSPLANLAGTTNLFRFAEIQSVLQGSSDGTHDIPHEDIDAAGAVGAQPHRRLLEQTRTRYLADDATAALPGGALESLALGFESYQLALTPGLLGTLAAKISVADATALLASDEGGYVDLDGDGRLWIPSGRVLLSPDPANPDGAFARAHRYLPQGVRDPFGNVARVEYDTHEQFIARSVDALGNTVSAQFDYRVLKPREITDPNGNRSAAAFDICGMAVATAVMGKLAEPDGKPKGDLLDGFDADLTAAQIDDFLNDPRGRAATLLGRATSRFVYDADRFRSTGEAAFSASIVRETHVADLEPGEQSRLRVTVVYSDGNAREIQSKLPAEEGPLEPGGASIDPRWIGSGWTIFNNKGKPVRQYEPFFSATHRFEFAVQRGVSPTLFYDPLMRVIATLHPDHGYEKVRFDPWWQQSWDANDTMMLDAATDPDVAPWFGRLAPADYLPGWHALRTDPAHAAAAAQRWPDPARRAAETESARKTEAHANTPGVAHLDSLGRTFLSIADNASEGRYRTRMILDVQGNERAVVDALGRLVMRRDFDMLGSGIHQRSMEAGERWVLKNIAGNPLRKFDGRGHSHATRYDALRRPIAQTVTGTSPDSDPRTFNRTLLVERFEYGEGVANAAQLNLRTRLYRHRDSAGLLTNAGLDLGGTPHDAFDFKGNPQRVTRQYSSDYTAIPDWQATPPLDDEAFESAARYDALNRTIQSVPPHSNSPGSKINVIQQLFDAGNLLRRVDVWLARASAPQGFLDAALEPPSTAGVAALSHDAKGRRRSVSYKNGITTSYEYDSLTTRLASLVSRRAAADFPSDCPQPPIADWPGCQAQNLAYTYDPVGNVTNIRDFAQQTIFFRNLRVEPSTDYTYDPVYRLVAAAGREHLGQAGIPSAASFDDAPRVGVKLSSSDGNAMGLYAESYEYDAVGNFLQIRHRGSSAANPGWTREYSCDEASQLEAARRSNRLTSTVVDQTAETYSTAGDGYDAHGNLLRLPNLPRMDWNFGDELCALQLGGGAQAHYVYDASGQRARKVVVKNGGTLIEERLYLGGFELFRKRQAGTLTLQRETLHVRDDRERIALVETRTFGDDGSPTQLIRYQASNHQGSASIEFDHQGRLLSYEEYYPFGSTSYQVVDADVRAAAKRYRYTGMERDEESGLSYHSARYYIPWLGRWANPDPSELVDGPNVYLYTHANPINGSDPSGRDDKQLWLMEQKDLEIRPIATRVARGISALQKAAIKVMDTWFGPQRGAHWGHPPTQPFNTQKAGTRVPLRATPGSSNMSGQNDAKVAGANAARTGGFRRIWDGNHSVDPTVPEGTVYKQPPPEPHVKALAPLAKNLPQRLPMAPTPPPTPPAVAPPSTQLELPFETGLAEAPKPQVCVPKQSPLADLDAPLPRSGGGGATLGKGLLLGARIGGSVLAIKGAIDDFEEEDYFGGGLNVGSLVSGPIAIVSGAYHLQKAEAMAYGAILNAQVTSAAAWTLYIQDKVTPSEIVNAHVDLSDWPERDAEEVYQRWKNGE